MFPAAAPSIYQSPKCFVSYGTMGYPDTKQAPRKGKPWTAVMSLDFIHKVDLILPSEAYDAACQQLSNTQNAPRYARVVMSLGDILQGDFFTEYIKKGKNYALCLSILTMFVDKETYERAGLVGKPYGAKGGRGSKPRWMVTYNLREPSMLRGHKGYDRLIYACKSVFTQPMTWLFCNSTTETPNPDPLQKFSPTACTSTFSVSQDITVLQPGLDVDPEILSENDRESLEHFATEVYEWFSLIRLGSSRVEPHDSIDPYLSRYSVPGDDPKEAKVCKLSWEGFMSAQWLRGLLMDVLVACPSRTWFSLSATSFSRSVSGNSDDLTILRPPSATGRYLMWETKSSD
ncbi:ribonuclease P MRP subunit POP1 [Fusarium pseudoanthophilum]|uniref:Ribonuclease P MRP subunit POP1 n=1 Tax=Fusarium pseudoanthophilum TaxID=48495 RepID=A0A8H5NRZ8_9HYPO|nr:ribonuclease P MRP subunit POP1 [Fusarium pseudoanthophilum]